MLFQEIKALRSVRRPSVTQDKATYHYSAGTLVALTVAPIIHSGTKGALHNLAYTKIIMSVYLFHLTIFLYVQ